MAKLIFRTNYFKNESARHKSNYVKYLGTREGAVFDPEQLPEAFWEDADMHGKKANYVDYLAGRPGAVRVEGQPHGLFSEKGTRVNLEAVMEEVATHQGTVWINVISLRREDAVRLGFDQLEKWQALLRSHAADLAETFQIKPANLKWYAAFHDEGHHPHVHLLVYSEKGDGYISKKGIREFKSKMVGDIFRDELTMLYDEKTKQRKSVKDSAGEELMKALEKMPAARGEDPEIQRKMSVLSQRLQGIKGKKVYGYLHRDVKAMVDDIFRELEKIPEVRDCYEKWMGWQRAIVGYYQDGAMESLPLSDNPEFKSIKNRILREAAAMQEKAREGQTGGRTVGKAGLTIRLLKDLEEVLMEKIKNTQSGRRMISEWKYRKEELERKAALGQKSDEGAEDITQTL